ncbi:uncharacterized protein si:dkey-12e7.1 [Erpetoichthys calabaricus]|uniref:Si:dkey-12e7.1 n=1 Tax=Erpetoichthys calabaricus TaxID=27687 RepID=A0A8C4T765_ERPCA|nr:uncharacterized protein si:dkey-12e7.1 [Erpetoichthys calabaricus]
MASKHKRPASTYCRSHGYKTRRRSRHFGWDRPTFPSSPLPPYEQQVVYLPHFNLLPVECQIHIFTFLSEKEKCTAALVCRHWSCLVRTGKLWRVADFTRLRAFQLGMEGLLVSNKDFEQWKAWVQQYAHHLISRQASLLILKASFDLGDPKHRWCEFLSTFLDKLHCGDLSEVGLNWTYTHFEPLDVCLESSRSSHQESLTKMDQVSNFQILLKKLVEMCPRITKMRLHFDWSETSVSLLTQFQHLCVLELKYFWVFKGVNPILMHSLTKSLPRLRSLTLHVLVPLRDLGISYSIESHSLEFLDVSQSRGLVFSCLKLPVLREFHAKKIVRGITLDRKTRLNIQSQWPCLYQLLRAGTPQLKVFNREHLLPSWKEKDYRELTVVLEQSCYCLRHSDSWLW